ncbi:MAG: hypothetical protein V2A76_08400 [Planctomycetota bacterium]
MSVLVFILALLSLQEEASRSPLVLTGFGPAAQQELQKVVDVQFRFVPPEDLLGFLALRTESDPVAALGYPLPLLIEAGKKELLEPFAEGPGPLAHEAFWAANRNYVGCWFSPVVVVRGLTEFERTSLEGVVPIWLPDRFEELGRAQCQEMLLLPTPRPWNALGVLLTALSRQASSEAESDRLLSGLDANRDGPYLPSTKVMLHRLEGTTRKLGVATLRDVRGFLETREATIMPHDPGGRPACLASGMAILRGARGRANGLSTSLSDPTLVARLGSLENLVPTSEEIGRHDLETWMLPYRVWFVGNAEQLARDQELADSVVSRFRSEIVGSLKRKEAVFSEYFDAIGIALMAIFIIWVIRHREDPAKPEN